MIDIYNKHERKVLIESYLDAETTVGEERALAEYFATHTADADEEAFAQLILASNPALKCLSDSGEQEFDRLVEGRRHTIGFRTALKWVSGIAAAIALVAIIRTSIVSYLDNQCDITPLEIAQTLNTLMDLSADEIESMTATPCGKNVLITAKMKDNSSSTYVLTREGDVLKTYYAWQNQ
ncbi:MAG: hypothetical protein J6W13_00480 [Salinivirgaceae bacterium]|nr:hypothetical protein [Salinivirgaceae bacterium]